MLIKALLFVQPVGWSDEFLGDTLIAQQIMYDAALGPNAEIRRLTIAIADF